MQLWVLCPIIDRDAGHVEEWAAAVRRAAPGGATLYVAARDSDRAAAAACRAAGVGMVTVPHYDMPPVGRHNYEGIRLKRQRLVEEALAGGADAVWFVDADVRVTPGVWAALRRELGEAPIAAAAYGVRWAAGRPVALVAEGGRAVAADVRSLGGRSARAVLAGMGCTVVRAAAARQIEFRVGTARLPDGSAAVGEDIGWFLDARTKGFEARVLAGVTVEHVGVTEPAPGGQLFGLTV